MNQKQGFFQVDTERLESEASAPWQWQDLLTCGASVVAIVFLCFLLVP
jgi:hypothetical protein